MTDVKKWHNRQIGEMVAGEFRKKFFESIYVETKEEALEYLLKFILPETSVAWGGSITLKEIGAVEAAAAKGAKIIEKPMPGDRQNNPKKYKEALRNALLADVYLCSSNAVTMDGCLVNIDGIGNRVAALSFGPDRVVVVVGINKIVKDIDAAWERKNMIAGPQNMKRIGFDNPCAKTGICHECESDDRGCRIYSIIHTRPRLTDFHIVIVGENLGY